MPIDPDLAEWIEQEQAEQTARTRRARLIGYFIVYGVVALFVAYSVWGTD